MKPASKFISSSVILILFFLSGLTSLVYEIVWSRILSTVLGNTSLAISIVVSIFLGGLAAGSFLAARGKLFLGKPIRVYGALELLIGLYSLCTPWFSGWIDHLYGFGYSMVAGNFWVSSLFKAGISCLLLLLPAIAMGATLPVLVRLFPSQERQVKAGRLYGLNTAGAVAGTLAAGYVLIPLLGITLTIHMTAIVNILIGSLALFALSGESEPEQPGAVTRAFRPLYLLFFLTGFASLSCEILWTRALSMFFGSSVYAFSSILAAFLLGIASGSSYYASRIPEDSDPYQFFSMVQFRLSLAGMFFIGVFMGVPFGLIYLFRIFYDSFPLFQFFQFLLIGCSIFYATFLSGAAFPAALHFFRDKRDEMQSHTGFVYSYNTFGSILGSFCAGFLFIPLIGVERSLRLMVLINLVLGIYCFRKSHPASQDKRILAIAGVSLALLILLPSWNRSVYNGGFYAFAYKYVPKEKKSGSTPIIQLSPRAKNNSYQSAELVPGLHSEEILDLLYYGEGLTATVAVVEQDVGIRSLLINGKPDASNVPTGDMRTQVLLGQLPILLSREAKEILVIGLGSGVTSGAALTHNPQKIDCVEIEKKVARAARYFEKENLRVLDHPRFHLTFDDGRNFVQHSDQMYDVITSEPSNLWMSGVANLFTREFFQTTRKRLRPGGIMCQWIHLYQISLKDILVFLKTYHSVFPYLSIWVDGSDMLVLGRDEPFVFSADVLSGKISDPKVQWSLERVGLSVSNILGHYLADERIMKTVESNLPFNTDDHPVLEFSAPKSLFLDHSEEISRDLAARMRNQE